MTPIISIDYDLDTDLYTLVATSYSVTAPAGPRLFRGGEHPDVRFVHDNKADAERDCKLLQGYCTAAWSGKAPKARGREEKEVNTVTLLDFRNAVWNC